MVLPTDERHIRLIRVLSLYRADGRLPFVGERPPMLVADVRADCVLCEDKVWRYEARRLQPIFVGRDIPHSISIDPKFLSKP